MPFDGSTFVQPSTMPVFRKRWFGRNKLDLRPAIWSLRNHPEEWVYENIGQYVIIHKPSNHKFWVANGWIFAGLDDTACSCSGSNSSIRDRVAFWRAYVAWRNSHTSSTNEQFRQHFIPRGENA